VSPIGNTYDLKVNDRVAWLGTGAYAEYSVCKAEKVFRLPEGIKPTTASASLLQGLTALTLIREAYEVKKGDWILVHAAAGGVGLWLCQLLRAVGAKVIGTASNPFKIELAKRHGGEYMIDYSHENIVARVKDITGGAGVAAVFDGVGASTFEADLEVLAPKGTLASFGNASGPVPPLTISRLSAKNLKICRPTLFNYISLREEFTKYTEELFNMVIKEKIDVNIHEIYALEDVAKAHTDLEGRKTTGKLLLRP
jgi:NADPH2:quinone reductase